MSATRFWCLEGKLKVKAFVKLESMRLRKEMRFLEQTVFAFAQLDLAGLNVGYGCDANGGQRKVKDCSTRAKIE